MRFTAILALMTALGSVPVLASVDSGLLSLIPADSKIITSVDVQQARSSDFGEYLMRRIDTENRDFEELRRNTGFDPLTDLQDFVFASSGPRSGSSRFLIVARGNFDSDRIETAAKNRGAAIQSYQGVDLVLPPGHHSQAFAFPQPGVAAFGDIESVRSVVANRANPIALDSGTQELISKAGTGNDAWFVANTGGNFLIGSMGSAAGRAPQQAKALDSILESSGGIHFGSIVQLSFDAVTRSPKDAVALADVVRFVASMLQTQRQNDKNAAILAGALDNMDLHAEGDSVHLSISIPEKSLEQLATFGIGAESRRHPAAAAR